MQNKRFLILSILMLSGHLLASGQVKEKTDQAIYKTIEAYNTQNYRAMKKQWGLLGKILVRKKRLKQEFAPQFDTFGAVVVDTIIYSSKYSATAKIKYKSWPDKRAYLQFIFNDQSKLQGFGQGYPVLIFRKSERSLNQLSIEEKERRIDSLVLLRYNKPDRQKLNGCISVYDQDRKVYQKCYGYADFEQKRPLNDSSLFLLASCSKQFTAIAIMMLQEKGLLNYHDPVEKHLPDFPYPEVTIHHLLTHTSGLPDYMTLFDKHWDKSKFARNRDILLMIKEKETPLVFKPDERFEYSNTGYAMLSLIIEKVSGQTFGNYLKEFVFEPLGMKHTVVNARRVSKSVPENFAYGYLYSKKKGKFVIPDSLENYDYVRYLDGITGDDGVNSNLIDLRKWNEALKNYSLVSKESMRLANQPNQLENGKETEYGFGIFLRRGKAIENIEYHTGGWPGYITLILRFPEQNKSLVILTNNSYRGFLSLADEISIIMLQ